MCQCILLSLGISFKEYVFPVFWDTDKDRADADTTQSPLIQAMSFLMCKSSHSRQTKSQQAWLAKVPFTYLLCFYKASSSPYPSKFLFGSKSPSHTTNKKAKDGSLKTNCVTSQQTIHFEGIHVLQVKTASVVCNLQAFKSADSK